MVDKVITLDASHLVKKDFFSPGVKVHFVGIGGIGMCGLAELLHHSGSLVTGSDLKENTQTIRLRRQGVPITIGHGKKNITGAEIVIYSSAVSQDNIELLSAKENNMQVISRSKALSEIVRLKRGLVVAGTHGKTSTTDFLANIFIHCQKDPTVIIGGHSRLFESTARSGQGEWFIVESDESDGGFKLLSPEIAIVTNVDKDHLDYYGSFEKLQEAFLHFVSKVPFYGCVVAWGDQKELKTLLSGIKQKVIFYGFDKGNQFVMKKVGSLQYEVFVKEKKLGTFYAPLPGAINALNALGAIIAAMNVGISFNECVKSLQLFQGVNRRFQKTGECAGVDFYDDYAHHPTEIRAVLSAFREKFGKQKRILVLFQPHRFSRTLACWNEFLDCFKEADKVFLIDIYSAGEKELNDVSSKKLAKQIHSPECLYKSQSEIPSLLEELRPGDVFVTMGAGSIDHYNAELLQLMKSQK